MGSIFRVSRFCLAVVVWILYTCIQLRHFYETAVRVPPTQRIVRSKDEIRLPSIYFCPADRGRVQNFKWHAFDCNLTFKEDQTTCPARVQQYRGRTPHTFSADGPGDKKVGGECLEFGTHMIGVRREDSAAWNEIALRASFDPGTGPGAANALQEAELGYLPVQWDTTGGDTQRFYYPLLRAPVFYVNDNAVGRNGPHPIAFSRGVAIRTFLAEEVDIGRRSAGKYWYTYGSMPLAVENVTMPGQKFAGHGRSPSGKLGIVHVILTLEDFEEFDFKVMTPFFPCLEMIGNIAGVGALLAWLVAGKRGFSAKHSEAAVGAEGSRRQGSSGFSPDCVKDEEAAGVDEDGSSEEDRALLGTEAPKRRSRLDDEGGAGQSLLGGQEGGDGL